MCEVRRFLRWWRCEIGSGSDSGSGSGTEVYAKPQPGSSLFSCVIPLRPCHPSLPSPGVEIPPLLLPSCLRSPTEAAIFLLLLEFRWLLVDCDRERSGDSLRV